MNAKRMLKHLLTPQWVVNRAFSKNVLSAIEAAIAASEKTHAGELRFAVEGALHPRALWHRQTARQRAEALFASLRVWDTAHNSGVLIYVQLVDRRIEIVADRGITAHGVGVPCATLRGRCAGGDRRDHALAAATFSAARQ